MVKSPWARRFRIAALIYGALVLGAAFPVLGWDVCTQYDMGLLAPLMAPLLVFFGLFVIFAFAFAAAKDGSVAGAFVLLLVVGFPGVMAVLGLATLRAENRLLWACLFLGGLLALSALATAAFCVSASA